MIEEVPIIFPCGDSMLVGGIGRNNEAPLLVRVATDMSDFYHFTIGQRVFIHRRHRRLGPVVNSATAK